MAYVPCTTGTVALYDQADGSTLALPVEAWGDDGRPYVAHETGLTPADTLTGFRKVEAAAVALPPAVETRRPERIGPGERPRPGVRPPQSGPRDPGVGRI